jgi:hypothetical protein
MLALGQMRPLQGDFIPEIAHIEGTMTFYLWYALIGIAHLTGLITHLPHEVNTHMADYATIMYVGRLMIAFFGTLGIILVYLIVNHIATNRLAAILAAWVYAILPFEVMHSHFMRPHVFGNFLLLLISYLSLQPTMVTSGRRIFGLGLLCGLTTAARYNLALVILIPTLTWCWTWLEDRKSKDRPKTIRAISLHSAVIYLSAGAVLGFVIGDPGVVSGDPAIRDILAVQAGAANRAQVGWPAILDLTLPILYSKEILPLGLGPLWVLLYLALVGVACLRKYYRATLPLLGFGLLYFFLLTKTYPFIALRTILPVFPLLAIFLGVMTAYLVSASSKSATRTWIGRIAVAVVLVWSLPSLVFAILVDKAMADKAHDPYLNTYESLDREATTGPITVGVVSTGWDWYMVGNFATHLSALPGRQVTVLDSKHDYLNEKPSADFLILYEAGPDEVLPIAEKRGEFLASGKYELVGDYENPINLGAWKFDYLRAPPDFRYPFARISLLARRSGQ